MSRIVELRLGKGRTTKPGEAEVWDKKYLEFTVKLPEKHTDEDIQEAIVRAEYLIDSYLGQPEVAEVENIPQLDIEELNKLPWKAKNKEPAGKKWGWIFGPEARKGVESGAEILAKALLHTKEHKFVLGDMEYSLSKDNVFIQRKPVKQESAKGP